MKFAKLMPILFCLVLLCSCGNVKEQSSDVLDRALAGSALPSGRIYTSEAGSDSVAYLSEELLETLYGSCSEEMKSVESCALFLSARQEVCEAAVFRCYAAGGTGNVERLCLRRKEILNRYAENVSSTILVCGKYVLMASGENADELISALRRAVR